MFGHLYAVEGIDGSGKTSAVKYLGDKLTELKIPHLLVRSYSDTEDAKFLRHLWINQRVSPECILQIVLELRVQVLLEQILPAMLEGKIVITDRWHDTTYAYQGFGQGLDGHFLKASFDQHFKNNRRLSSALVQSSTVEERIVNFSTIYLGVTPETSRSRVGLRGQEKDAFENQGHGFFERVLMGYNARLVNREVFKENTGTIWKIDANQDLPHVNARLDEIAIGISKLID